MDSQGPVGERVSESVPHDEAGASSADNSGKQPSSTTKAVKKTKKDKWLSKSVLKPALVIFVGFLFTLLIAGFIYLSVTGISVFQISGNSMEPTLKNGTSVILKQSKGVKNGLIIFFNKPGNWTRTSNENPILVKRIAAVPGDTLSFNGKAFNVNGTDIYTLSDDGYECKNAPQDYKITLNRKQVFVLGDNAKESIDSRSMFCQGKINTIFIKKSDILDYGTIKWTF